jgi:gluconokinase
MIIVLMGVSGAGKTTIGMALAARTGLQFADADDYHSAASKEKMAAGRPLNDADRAPWLATLNQLLLRWDDESRGGILACSALEEKYRVALAKGIPASRVHFVLLEGSPELIAKRLAKRKHAFMNPKLLESQFATLEPPRDAIRVVNDKAPEEIVEVILRSITGELRTGGLRTKGGEKMVEAGKRE